MRVLHRDMKPDNILIFPDGRAALCDFGASRFSLGKTREYTEAGTLGYIAPEQAYGRVRFASDVFSLGLIAYEVLSGVLPTWPFECRQRATGAFAPRCPSRCVRCCARRPSTSPRNVTQTPANSLPRWSGRSRSSRRSRVRARRDVAGESCPLRRRSRSRRRPSARRTGRHSGCASAVTGATVRSRRR